jgi:hypothetical protein
MDKVKALIEALNDASKNITLSKDGVKYIEQDASGKITSHLFIKLRAVADEDGVERMKYVAREQ